MSGTVAGLVILGQPVAQSQTSPPKPSFEVASIKLNKSLYDGGSVRFPPAGRFLGRNVSLRPLIAIAYKLKAFQLLGGPSWIDDERYDIDAMAEGTPPPEQIFLMLQSLLAERFNLAVHWESRELKGFSLVAMKAGQPGPKMRPSSVNCSDLPMPAPCMAGGIRIGDLKMIGTSTGRLIDVINGEVKAPVIDETRLDGTFDVELHWSPELANSLDLPSIFTALQEQLGLKLVPKLVPADVLVIDRAEHPTPN